MLPHRKGPEIHVLCAQGVRNAVWVCQCLPSTVSFFVYLSIKLWVATDFCQIRRILCWCWDELEERPLTCPWWSWWSRGCSYSSQDKVSNQCSHLNIISSGSDVMPMLFLKGRNHHDVGLPPHSENCSEARDGNYSHWKVIHLSTVQCSAPAYQSHLV